MTGDWKVPLTRKFNNKLKGILSKFNPRLKSIRRASIKHKGYKSLFVHSSEHLDNKESKNKNMLSVIPRVKLKSESKARKYKYK